MEQHVGKTFASVSTSPSVPMGVTGGQPELEGRWRDLYLSNEIEAEEAIEMRIAQSHKCPQKNGAFRRMATLQISMGLAAMGEGFHPYSSACTVWQLISSVLMLYDGMSIPLNLAWDLELRTEGFQFLLFLVTVAFWTADILYNLNAGYFDSGMLVLSRSKIRVHYAILGCALMLV